MMKFPVDVIYSLSFDMIYIVWDYQLGIYIVLAHFDLHCKIFFFFFFFFAKLVFFHCLIRSINQFLI